VASHEEQHLSGIQDRIRAAWQGRISGCQLGKAVELLSVVQGHDALTAYLARAGALPLRDYVPLLQGTLVEQFGRASCRRVLERSEPDDDINYTVLALLLLEEHGLALRTSDVARVWLRRLPAAATFTAERAAYRTLLERGHEWFAFGAEPGFDLADCANNEYREWIGAQIRADLYGWVCPGRPGLAADLARRDATLSHGGDGVRGAAFVAAVGAAIPAATSLEAAVEVALREIPGDSAAAEAVRLGRTQAGKEDGARTIRERYAHLPPLHTVNNLALVVWAVLSYRDDFGAAIGEVVAAGLDTDCNGATVGGLWGLQGKPIPELWTTPWQGRVAVTLAGLDELRLDDLVRRTDAVAERIAQGYEGMP
jgi:ADP-ribosylglycohydrolase